MRWPPSGLQKPGHMDLWIRDRTALISSLAFQNIPVEGILLELGK